MLQTSQAQATQINQTNELKKMIKMPDSVSEMSGRLSSLIKAGDSTSIFMTPLLHPLEIIRFTDIVLPMNIKMILDGEKMTEGSKKT